LLLGVAMLSLVCVGVCNYLTTYTYITTVAPCPEPSSFLPED